MRTHPPRRRSVHPVREGKQSRVRFVQYAAEIKDWLRSSPTVEAARPPCCPCCGAASSPPGASLRIHGHGVRTRQVRGPLSPEGSPEIIVLTLRRYRCQRCRAVITVGPPGLMPGWLYSAQAIGWALALYGLAKRSAADVRRRVSPWPKVGNAAFGSWATLRRWIKAVRSGRLFAQVRPCPAAWTLRQIAERAATTLAAQALPLGSAVPLDHHAWHGAAQLGRAIAM